MSVRLCGSAFTFHFHTSLFSLNSPATSASSSTVLVPPCDTTRCSRDRKPMPNPEIAITIHTPPDASTHPSEDFELAHYPNHQHTDWKSSHKQEELPFYMIEDTSARRRVPHTPQGPTPPQRDPRWDDEYDGEGKDVYAKASASQRYGGGGRVVRRAPPPPPTSFVGLCTACLFPVLPYSPSTSFLCLFSLFPHLARIFSAKLRACRTCRLHSPVLLDTVSQDRPVAERDMGRGALWQVWFALPQARLLL